MPASLVTNHSVQQLYRRRAHPWVRMEHAQADVKQSGVALGGDGEQLADLVVRSHAGGQCKVDGAAVLVAEL